MVVAHVGQQDCSCRRDQAKQQRIVKGGDHGSWIDPLDKQDLAAKDVADAGHHPLIQDRLGDRGCRSSRVAQSLKRPCRIERLVEQVRSDAPEHRVDRLGARIEELDNRSVEARGDHAVELQDEHGSSGGSPPGLAGFEGAPGSRHAQMGS